MAVCDKDCFNCPYPDCINDQMDHEDYIEASARDKELRATPKSKKRAAQQKAYYEANREKLAAQQKVLRQLRRELGFSLKAAARILGVCAATVSNWERGLAPCDVNKAVEALRQGAG